MPLQQTSGNATTDAYGGGVAAVPNYIEDVFSTYLYTGNSSTQTINNGIDLAGKGGLTWIKVRDYADSHRLFDTTRGVGKYLVTNGTFAETTNAASVTAFNSNGFSLGDFAGTNGTAFGSNYASWTFRKQPKFFDVVTWTGNGVNDRAISHNLGSAPGCIIIKRTDNADDWYVYHRSLNSNYWLLLNSSAAQANAGFTWTTVTSTTFTVPSGAGFNASGGTYVAYLFAHDAGGFGLTGTDNVISCGSYTGTGSPLSVTLGYEPQWILVKRTSTAGNDWILMDTMRGMSLTDASWLNPNTSAAETTGLGQQCNPTATGFDITSTGTNLNAGGSTYIYIAIRRGPMKVPTSGTSVFTPLAVTVPPYSVTAGFPVDLAIFGKRTGTSSNRWLTLDRLRGGQPALITSDTAAENYTYASSFASNTKFTDGWSSSGDVNVYELFRRAPSFFDEVCYTGNSTSGATQTHNLGVVPELMIVKERSASGRWYVYNAASGATNYMELDTTIAASAFSGLWNDTAPTSTVFTLGNYVQVNQSGQTYVAYLFATCAGVSKVGSYTGTGTTLQVDCGFTGGARFVLIKRTDSTGDWYVWDSARGIVAGNDPYLLLNSTAAEVTNTDYVDTYSAGFEITSTAPAAINASGGTFIFLAIA